MVTARKRLDIVLVERNFAADRDEAQALIGTGRVLLNGQVAGKAGSMVDRTCQLALKEKKPFVSRGGEKLAAGLDAFAIDPADRVCGDIGCSTGGFTDCLLKRGAVRVYSVDVGYGVLDWKLRQDSRVIVLERTNARYLTAREIPEPLDLAVIDASFISLQLLLPPVAALFADTVRIVALVKPQFELPRDKVARGGIVRDRTLHDLAVSMVRQFAGQAGLRCREVIESPVRGAKGNLEFLMYLTET